MELYGKVKNGLIVPERSARLDEGERVSIKRLKKTRPKTKHRKGSKKDKADFSDLRALLLKFAGTIKGPRDWAENHDHYIHGTPKRTK